MSVDFNHASYEKHRKQYEHKDASLGKSWGRKDTVDYWRHQRMYQTLDAIIEGDPTGTWLTVGDGRYGTDANYLLSKGIVQVIATDISETYLKVAKRDGFIKDYRIENAERINMAEGAIDYVLCKESYHHFPRPMVALYEMLRVATKGVVLIEPQDSILPPYRKFIPTVPGAVVSAAKQIAKKLLGKEAYYEFGRYETVGNYVYTISEREIEKVALGLNYDMVAFKGLNDYYEEGVENEKADPSTPLFRKVKNEIQQADDRVKNGKATDGLLTAMIFKSMPPLKIIQALEQQGFTVKRLPKNPYA